jgi:hypothetical protein
MFGYPLHTCAAIHGPYVRTLQRHRLALASAAKLPPPSRNTIEDLRENSQGLPLQKAASYAAAPSTGHARNSIRRTMIHQNVTKVRVCLLLFLYC